MVKGRKKNLTWFPNEFNNLNSSCNLNKRKIEREWEKKIGERENEENLKAKAYVKRSKKL